MCMLTVFPLPGLLDDASRKGIRNGSNINDDGHGFAVVVNGRIRTGRSMDAETVLEQFEEVYAKATGPAIFHSRWSTHGATDLTNCHPFPVRKMHDTFLAHNGIMPFEALPAKGDKRSDTRVFADDILPIRFRRLDDPKVRHALDVWLGGNKIAILSTNRALKRQLYVFGLEMGEWQRGVWYSNSDYQNDYAHWWSKYDKTDDTSDDCLWCHQAGKVDKWAVCQSCGTCQDCFEPQDTCQCYVSTTAIEAATADDDDPDSWPTILGQIKSYDATRAIESGR
jgi:hypothetical protein